MISMQEDLRAMLLAEPELTALVGTRITWNGRAQGSPLPAIVLTTVSEVTDYTYGASVTLLTSRVQADIWATSYGSAIGVDRAMAPTLNGYRGHYGATDFEGIFLESRFDGAEEPAAGAGPIHRISRDVIVKHKEAL
jgi:hypothetical protein